MLLLFNTLNHPRNIKKVHSHTSRQLPLNQSGPYANATISTFNDNSVVHGKVFRSNILCNKTNKYTSSWCKYRRKPQWGAYHFYFLLIKN